MSNEPPTIEHNPHEKRLGNGVWWFMWPAIGLLWLGTWYFWGFDWHQVALGGLTGGVLATFAIEVTGNKAPEWMKGSAAKRPSRHRKL